MLRIFCGGKNKGFIYGIYFHHPWDLRILPHDKLVFRFY